MSLFSMKYQSDITGFISLLMCSSLFLHFLPKFWFKVEKCVSQLEHIIKGDIVAAKRLDSVSIGESSDPEDSDGSHKSCSTVHSGAQYDKVEHLKPQEWTSLQSAEAKSILNNFMKIKTNRCRNCKAKNPAISKPTFGWIHMVYLFISFLLGIFLNVYLCLFMSTEMSNILFILLSFI